MSFTPISGGTIVFKWLKKHWLGALLASLVGLPLIGGTVFLAWWSLQPRQVITGYNNVDTHYQIKLKLGSGKHAASLHVRYAGDGRLILTHGAIMEDHPYQLCGVSCGEERVHVYSSHYIFVTMHEDGTIDVRWESPIKFVSFDPLN